VKRELPLAITAAIGVFMILSFFVPHQAVSVPADFLQASAIIVVAFGYVLGGANVLRVNFDGIYKRQPDWPYKILLLVGLIVTFAIGAIDGVEQHGGFLNEGTRYVWAPASSFLVGEMAPPMPGEKRLGAVVYDIHGGTVSRDRGGSGPCTVLDR